MSVQREQREKSADRIRGELMETLQELERRKQRVLAARVQLTSLLVAVGFAAGALSLIGVLATKGIRRRGRRMRLRRDRLRGVLRAWEHPKRLASRGTKQRLPAALLRRVGLTVGTSVAAQLARQVMAKQPEITE
ncbi:MAG: hypothetical protein ACT4TC_14430 [Myxococcaceae bacterium]